MNCVNKTLYIPLYGKVFVSRKGIILSDAKAEEIWDAEGFELKGKAKSKWLAYYMGMRSAVFDHWLKGRLQEDKDVVVLHIGCGMDSRAERIGTSEHLWYDIDFPEVIEERGRYYSENDRYHMIGADARDTKWLSSIPGDKTAVIVMEGVSMYFRHEELNGIMNALRCHFEKVYILMDCYTTFAAKASRYKNPINDVGVTEVYGLDEPRALADCTGLFFVQEHEMTPARLIDQLNGFEKIVFKTVFAGGIAKKMYRLYEYRS